MKIIAIIPARFESKRLPGKVLVDIHGQSVIQRVFLQAIKSDLFDEVIVATDHRKIFDHCNKLGMNVEMTSSSHTTGTDRVAEVAEHKDADIVINIQGDEPFIEIDSLKALTQLMQRDEVSIGTLFRKIDLEDSIFDFNTVKIVNDINGKVLYFSRHAIPAQRDIPFRDWSSSAIYYQHIGVYGFKKKTLLEIVNLPIGKLEQLEKLEQLRWLENGFSMYATEVDSVSFGIDTPEDLERARKFYR